MSSERPITAEQATNLLKLGLSRQRRPVDDLLDRLRRPDAEAWLDRALAAGPLEGFGTAETMFLDGAATIEQLTAIKDRSKKMLTDAAAAEEGIAGLAGYFLAIATGLYHRRTLVGAKGRPDLEATLLDLAEVAPEAYGLMLCAATLELETLEKG